MNKIKTAVLCLSFLILGAASGAGYVYNDAINNDAAHFTPRHLGIAWGQLENGIIVDALPEIGLSKKRGK